MDTAAPRDGLASSSTPELLRLHHCIIEALRSRGVLRSSNNPVADYTEWLVSTRLALTLAGNSTSGHDATDSAGVRYQIKGRRLTAQNRSTQLGQMRRLDTRPFDSLLAVVFNPDFTIAYGASVPLDIVVRLSRFSAHTNAHVFSMRRDVLGQDGVTDITALLAG